MVDQIPADDIRQNPGAGLAKELFVVRSTPTQGLEAIAPYLDRHLQYYQDLERKGLLFAAGPLFTNRGQYHQGEGLIILNAKSFSEAEQLAAADPLHQQGVRHYTIEAWLLCEGSLNLRLTFGSGEIELK
ncbi:YciI family protein [Leptolyngbya sp. AN03gr2]|uniref:YciI family protein n=1 Tax=unclassified Leptolyngbya TaxID=2650499 RepID=UPI003D31B7AE